jgi:sugar lactone lactonase YvrE
MGENVGAFRSPQDIHAHENFLYLADSGNNRIIIFEFFEDNSYEVVDIKKFALLDGEPTNFNNPHGIFVSPWLANYGQIWVADTDNQRVLHLDEDWNVITEILHPGRYGISLLDENSDFLPSKLAVDFSGRLFVQTRHVNRGLMEFDRDGVFACYMGAPPVEVGIIDRFRRLVSTSEQRERMLLNVPVEYTNLSIDHEGFIYVTTSSEDVEPVARLNAMGEDVLIRNGQYGTGAGRSGMSEFIAVTALPNNTFITFDRNRGRLFAYDQQGEILYIWGGPGNREGFFTFPTALDHMGYSLFALDGGIDPNLGAITRFDLTEYGALINQALDMYMSGLYEESYDVWNDVLRYNGNFALAYIGIARAHLRMGNYREAMHFFRLQNDFRNHGRAFNFYRRIWMEENFWIFALALGILMVVPPVVKKVIKVRREIKES